MKRLKNYQIRAMESLEKYFHNCNELNDPDLAYYQTTNEIFGIGMPYNKVSGLENVPYVCLRIPTGGGKTLMACYAIEKATNCLLHAEQSVVVWLVPSNQIKKQTLEALKDQNHDYRQALDSMFNEVNVYDICDALSIKRSTLDSSLTIIVSTMQALRIEDTDGRKVYESSGDLMEHFVNVPSDLLDKLEKNEGGVYKKSLANVLYMRRPILVVDEAHNARTELSFDTLSRINPSCIIEFTATPNTTTSPSNVIHNASAAELKAEDMIKVPILIETKNNWQEIITMAIGRLNVLNKLAIIEKRKNKKYIRPIMLIQAEANRSGKDNITPTVLKKYLCNDLHIPEEEIAIETGNQKELEGINILEPTCKVKFVITIQALREGWDCPFAYVLCSVAEMKSSTAIEQIIGRIMRMPYAEKKCIKELNQAYAYVTSNNFFEVAKTLEEALVQNGFNKVEAKDYIRVGSDKFEQLGLESIREEGDISVSKLGFYTVKVSEKPNLEKLEELTREKITYDDKSQILTFYGEMNKEEMHEVSNCFIKEDSVNVIEEFHNAISEYAKKVKDAKTPYEKRLEFSVPALSVKQGNLFELFDDSLFLDNKWDILSYDYTITEGEYKISDETGKVGEVTISDSGQINSRCISEIQEQVNLFSSIDTGWSTADLVNWLDRNIKHPDISTLKSIPYISGAISSLINERQIKLSQLVVDRYNLKNVLEKIINKHRLEARKKSYQLYLFGEYTQVVVEPSVSFDFSKNPYPASSYYSGGYQFKKHYFEHVGELLNQGEEFECAQFIDSLPEVVYWVRNLERKQGSFWLQTSTDKFYPDFICFLKSGQYLAVEYKGADRYSNDDSKEKRLLGQLWEMRSEGKCLFIMTKGKELESIRNKIKNGMKKC